MDNFLYCYLSPFMVGMVTVISVFVAAIFVVFLLIMFGQKIYEIFDHKVPYYSTASKLVRGTGTWIYRILMGIIVLVFVAMFGNIFWETGIEILKRFVCR